MDRALAPEGIPVQRKSPMLAVAIDTPTPTPLPFVSSSNMTTKLLLTLALFAATISASAQNGNASPSAETLAAGDSPANPGPLAADLSPALTHKDIRKAMKKVDDWEIATAEKRFSQLWTFAALYRGMLAYSHQTGDPAGHDAVLRASENFKWQLVAKRFPHADDEAIGFAYEDLYADKPDPIRLADTKATMDRLIARPDEAKPVWWWCDALFMAPPVLVRLAAITGDHKYIDYMDREWAITARLLYDNDEHLYYRDERFIDPKKKHEANGKKVFWSRGDGWVVAGLAEILDYLPANDPLRPKYVAQFRDMVSKIASLQPPDGLWRTGLLDAEAYKMPEVSGSAFFTYAMAYGINHGLLDRAQYEPIVRKSWAAMVAHIYADGRLGNIQPIGYAPDQFEPASSYNYGVGGFLLAGSELDRMIAAPPTPHHTPQGHRPPHRKTPALAHSLCSTHCSQTHNTGCRIGLFRMISPTVGSGSSRFHSAIHCGWSYAIPPNKRLGVRTGRYSKNSTSGFFGHVLLSATNGYMYAIAFFIPRPSAVANAHRSSPGFDKIWQIALITSRSNSE
jgi:unsaturated rhamnogalacturonyl hydrolase